MPLGVLHSRFFADHSMNHTLKGSSTRQSSLRSPSSLASETGKIVKSPMARSVRARTLEMYS
jgi:hypothetical protein